MVAVHFTETIFSVVANPEDSRAFCGVDGSEDLFSLPAEYRRGAGGRVRQFSRAGRSVSWTFTLPALVPEEVRWLRERMGRLMCLRDPRGRKVFGSYIETPSWDVPSPQYYSDVTIAFTEITHSEEV